MRYAKFTFALLGLAAALTAADPFVGTWKLNPAKSKYKTGQPPKEQTVTITEAGKDLDVTIKGITAEGKPISSQYTVPAAGGQGRIIQSANADAVSGKRMGPNQREVAYSKAGKVTQTVQTRVSPDGKTLTARIKGTDPAGRPVDAVAVLEKQ
jgi:hypothetical protein